MKALITVFGVCCVVFAMCIISSGQSLGDSADSQSKNEDLAVKARKEVDTLLAERTFAGVVKLVKKWKSLSEMERKEVLVELLVRMESLDLAELTEVDDMVVVSRLNNKTMTARDFGLRLVQDVFTVGGRCAFAVEGLLDCRLPAITEEMKPDALHKAVQEAHFTVIRCMRLPKAPPKQ